MCPKTIKEEQALHDLLVAINNLEGIEIPYPIIKNSIIPLKEWLINNKKRGDGSHSSQR